MNQKVLPAEGSHKERASSSVWEGLNFKFKKITPDS
jgi:hypothetical protein